MWPPQPRSAAAQQAWPAGPFHTAAGSAAGPSGVQRGKQSACITQACRGHHCSRLADAPEAADIAGSAGSTQPAGSAGLAESMEPAGSTEPPDTSAAAGGLPEGAERAERPSRLQPAQPEDTGPAEAPGTADLDRPEGRAGQQAQQTSREASGQLQPDSEPSWGSGVGTAPDNPFPATPREPAGPAGQAGHSDDSDDDWGDEFEAAPEEPAAADQPEDQCGDGAVLHLAAAPGLPSGLHPQHVRAACLQVRPSLQHDHQHDDQHAWLHPVPGAHHLLWCTMRGVSP